jgi:hypothetical protein
VDRAPRIRQSPFLGREDLLGVEDAENEQRAVQRGQVVLDEIVEQLGGKALGKLLGEARLVEREAQSR